MKKFLNAIPLPITGLMLGIATLGNIFAKTPIVRPICGVIASVILILVFLKIIFTFDKVKDDLKNPMIATTFSTFDMGIMVLCTYLKPMAPSFSKIIWLIAIAFHIIWLIFCIMKFLFPFNIKKLIPSFFIPFVGIAVASITAPVFEQIKIGQIAFYFGFISLIILTPLILYRVFKISDMQKPMLPSKAIIAAPASLCLAGYLSSFIEPSILILYVLVMMAIVMTIVGLSAILSTIKNGFFPSFSAYTFPMVISAMAMLKLKAFFMENGQTFLSVVTSVFYYIEIVISIVVVTLVLIIYTKAIINNINKDK